jgi:ribonuclease Z
MVSTILITHLHSDHITDLNDLVTTRWVMMPVNVPLKVVGPVGTRQVVDAMLHMLTLDQGYRHAHHDDLRANGPLTVDVVEVGPGETFNIGEVSVSTHATDHRPVDPSIGFRIEHDGKVAALAGDTIPCAGLDDLCLNADIYVQTVIRDDMVKQLATLLPNSQRFLDILDYHSTVSQAGQTAARNNVKTLMLTHCVPAVQPGQEDDWIDALVNLTMALDRLRTPHKKAPKKKKTIAEEEDEVLEEKSKETCSRGSCWWQERQSSYS